MMGAHSPTPEELMAYLDGELAADASRAVVAHLADCDRCRQLADELRGVSRDARSWQVGEAPDSLRCPEAAPAAVTWRSSRVWRVVRTRTFAAVAATVVVVAVVVAVASRGARKSVPQSVVAESIADMLSAPASRAAQSTRLGGGAGGPARPMQAAVEPGAADPLVARTVTLRIVTSDFDAARRAIDRTLRDVGGVVGQLGATDSGQGPRSIHGTLRVPAARLDDAVAAFKTLGRVLNESQDAEDVAEQIVDLDVRTANARITEKRLIELIQTRTGRVSDVLEAEREIARVRTEVERLDAQRKNVQRRVDYAIVVLDVAEEARASVTLGPQPVPARVRHAMANGLSSALSSLLSVVLFVLRAGPAIVLWTTLLGLPAWWFVRHRRRAAH